MTTPSKVEELCAECEQFIKSDSTAEFAPVVLLRRAVTMLREMEQRYIKLDREAYDSIMKYNHVHARAEKAEKELADLRLRINGFLFAEGESPVTFPEER